MASAPRKILFSMVAVTLAFSATSCANTKSAQSNSSKILEISGETLDGKKISFTSFSSKPTVIWFWTPWCAICVGEAPTINNAYAKYADEVNFVGVGAQGTNQEMKDFVQITETSKLLQIYDFDSSVWAHFEIPLQPSLVFVGSNGYVDRQIGPITEEKFQKRLDLLLETKA